MKGLKGLKNLIQAINKSLNSKQNPSSGKFQFRLVDPNRLHTWWYC